MNRWINRAMALIALLFVYGAGLSAGREQCELRHQHPAFHPNLKP